MLNYCCCLMALSSQFRNDVLYAVGAVLLSFLILAVLVVVCVLLKMRHYIRQRCCKCSCMRPPRRVAPRPPPLPPAAGAAPAAQPAIPLVQLQHVGAVPPLPAAQQQQPAIAAPPLAQQQPDFIIPVVQVDDVDATEATSLPAQQQSPPLAAGDDPHDDQPPSPPLDAAGDDSHDDQPLLPPLAAADDESYDDQPPNPPRRKHHIFYSVPSAPDQGLTGRRIRKHRESFYTRLPQVS